MIDLKLNKMKNNKTMKKSKKDEKDDLNEEKLNEVEIRNIMLKKLGWNLNLVQQSLKLKTSSDMFWQFGKHSFLTKYI